MIRKRNNTNGSPRWHHQTSLPLSTLHKQSAKNNHFGIMLLCSVIVCVLMLLTTLIFANSHAKSSSSGEISHHSTIKYVDIIGGDTQFYDVIVVGCGPAGIAGALFASRMGLSVLVLGSPSSGALSGTNQLENFPAFAGGGGQTWILTSIEQAHLAGAQFAPPTITVTGISQTKIQQHTMFDVRLNLESSKKVVSKL